MRQKLPKEDYARVIYDGANPHVDQFVPLKLAAVLYKMGELVQIDMGPSYPNSFVYKKKSEPPANEWTPVVGSES